MTAATLTAAEQFFYDYAGMSYNPLTETAEQGRVRGAKTLAAAELERIERGWWIQITHDDDVMEDDAGSVELVRSGKAVCLTLTLVAESDDDIIANQDPDVLASISNVIVHSTEDPYVRVLSAELVVEVIGTAGLL